MNIMRKIFLTFLLVAFASAAFAEGTPKKPSVAGFVSNGFWDNWEVSAGFGPAQPSPTAVTPALGATVSVSRATCR